MVWVRGEKAKIIFTSLNLENHLIFKLRIVERKMV